MWQHFGIVKVVDIGNGYHMTIFSYLQDDQFALHEGPWIVAEHQLLVQRWRPNFDPFNDELKKVLVWIRVPRLPVEYYNRHILWRSGNLFGKT